MTTVVFADLVGSTSMFQRLGDETASRFVTQLMGLLRKVFEHHRGRVIKVLGDGIFVVFEQEGDALVASISIQRRLLDKPIYAGGSGAGVQLQMGIDSGEVVEIGGDCFGDTVNSAARLADLAGSAQILTTENVWATLLPVQRAALRSIGPMYLRGRTKASHVYRVEWQAGRDEDATMAGRSMMAVNHEVVELMYAGKTTLMNSKNGKLSIGRAAEAALSVNDPRVSRVHATLEWRGGQFVLADASSFGTWVYLGNQAEAMVLRRTECYLVGNGEIVPGCGRSDENAPLIQFSVKN
jgi:adenylate cyclase